MSLLNVNPQVQPTPAEEKATLSAIRKAGPKPGGHPLLINDKELKELIANLSPSDYTQKIADTIIKRDPFLISYIPTTFLNQNLCNEILKSNFDFKHIFPNIPSQFRTNEMCEKIYRESIRPWSLSSAESFLALPNSFVDSHLDLGIKVFIDCAKKFDSTIAPEKILNKISPNLLTVDFFKEILDKDTTVLSKIPQKYLTKDIYLYAIEKTDDLNILKDIPPQIIDLLINDISNKIKSK